jgi:hypothetical protein
MAPSPFPSPLPFFDHEFKPMVHPADPFHDVKRADMVHGTQRPFLLFKFFLTK